MRLVDYAIATGFYSEAKDQDHGKMNGKNYPQKLCCRYIRTPIWFGENSMFSNN